MRVLIIALLAAISYAQTVQVVGDCEARSAETCASGTGDDGFPCQWHVGDQSCKENTGGGGFASTSGTPVNVEGGGSSPVTPVFVDNDGCEEFPETSCSTQFGENGEPCHWVAAEGCKKADCEHWVSSETCTGKNGEHGRACVWLADEGCEETPGVDGDGNNVNDHDGCEAYTADTCSGNVGENGVACHWYENECKESNCEHYLTQEACNVATAENGETCSWNLGDGCKEANDPSEPNCDYYGQEECAQQTGENGSACYWDVTENDGLGKCDNVEAAELPGVLRSIHSRKEISSPTAWTYFAVFFGTFFLTAGITFTVLKKCSQAPVEDIDLSYRAVV